MTAKRTKRIEADVIIIGAGLAGLVAATELNNRGLTVAVLEARNRVGGRLLNHPIGDGKYVELGGEWFGPASTVISDFARQRGIGSFRSYDDGDKLVVTDTGITRYTGNIPKLGTVAAADARQALKRLDLMAATIPHGRPWDATWAPQWDSQTFWSWTRRNLATNGGRRTLEAWAHVVIGAAPSDFSLLHALYYARSSGGVETTVAVRGGAQESRFEGGAQGIAIGLAAELAGKIHLELPVREVRQEPDSVCATGTGFIATGRYLVSAVPVSLAGRIHYTPALPSARDRLTQRMPAGSVIKCVAVYPEPFWRKDGLAGQAVCLSSGPVRAVLDTSPQDGSPGVLTAFAHGAGAQAISRLPCQQRRLTVLTALSQIFGTAATRPDQYIEQDWTAEPWTRGCYHGLAQPGTYTAFGAALREPVGRIHWAGSETGAHAMGSMGGAVESGRRVADEIADRWN